MMVQYCQQNFSSVLHGLKIWIAAQYPHHCRPWAWHCWFHRGHDWRRLGEMLFTPTFCGWRQVTIMVPYFSLSPFFSINFLSVKYLDTVRVYVSYSMYQKFTIINYFLFLLYISLVAKTIALTSSHERKKEAGCDSPLVGHQPRSAQP